MSFGVLVFTLAESVCPSLVPLIIVRLFLGYFVGLATVVCPLYVSEMSPEKYRGTLGSTFQVSITFGILLSYIIGYFLRPEVVLSPYLGWRLMFGLGAIPSLIMVYLSLFSMEDSPNLTEYNKKVDSVINENIDLMRDENEFAYTFSYDKKASGWKGLFQKPFNALFVGIMMAVTLQGTGINGIIFYLPKLLQDAGLKELASLLTIMVGVWNFISTFFTLLFVDKVGRKPLLMTGIMIMILSLVSVGISFYAFEGKIRGWIAFSAILVFHSGFEIGPGVLFWIIIAEIFPDRVKSQANGFINLINNIINLMVSLLFPIIFEFAQGAIFFFFAAVAVVSWIFLFFKYHELKNNL